MPVATEDPERTEVFVKVQRRMLNLREERPFFCPHGLKGSTSCSCWNNWGKFV